MDGLMDRPAGRGELRTHTGEPANAAELAWNPGGRRAAHGPPPEDSGNGHRCRPGHASIPLSDLS